MASEDKNFEEFFIWAEETFPRWKRFNTLGKRSFFEAKYNVERKSIIIRTSTARTQKELNHNALLKIFNRFIDASRSDRYRSSYYQIQSWKGAPDKIVTPAIPALFKYWENRCPNINLYGRIAVKAFELFARRISDTPRNAWLKAAEEECQRDSSKRKGCPMGAFLGLCEEGRIKGIPVGRYTASKSNKAYALKGLQELQKNSEYVHDIISLWKKVTGEKRITHNGQMDVVVALWEKKLLTGI